MGFGFALMGPARQAWLGELIPRRLLANGVALQQMSQNIARVLGPMLGAIIVFVGDIPSGWLYLSVAGFFLIVVPLTTMLPWTKPPRAEGDAPRRSAIGDLIHGFGYLPLEQAAAVAVALLDGDRRLRVLDQRADAGDHGPRVWPRSA